MKSSITRHIIILLYYCIREGGTVLSINKIFFDLDDTLHDHQKPFAEALIHIFPTFPQRKHIQSVYKRLRHYSDLLWVDYNAGTKSLDELRIERIILALKDFHFPISKSQASEFQQRYEQELFNISLFHEIPEILSELQQRFEIGIITNGPVKHQSNKIKALGLERFIPSDRIFISDGLGIAKPDPNIFLEVAKRVKGVPHEMLYIGDTWKNDVIGPIEAGWQAIWFNHRKRQRETDHQPMSEITTLHELIPKIILT